ncbi:hypothetical protein V2J09_003206 [Rumex salicifolius]
MAPVLGELTSSKQSTVQPMLLQYKQFHSHGGNSVVQNSGGQIGTRHITQSVVCDRCGVIDESIWHCLVVCSEADLAWTLLLLRQTHGLAGVEELLIRNKVLFEEGFTNGDVVQTGLLKLVVNYSDFRLNHRPGMSTTPARVDTSTWQAPPIGKLKLNVDVVLLNGNLGFGAVCRNENGELVMVASKCTQWAVTLVWRKYLPFDGVYSFAVDLGFLILWWKVLLRSYRMQMGGIICGFDSR